MVRRRKIFVLAMLALLVVSGGCASTTAAIPSNELHTLAPGWERFFKIEWQARKQKGRPILTGTIENTWGVSATRVQLLVEGLDEKGTVVHQDVVRLAGDVPPFARTYFELPVQSSPRYRVSVFAYDWSQALF